MKWVFTIILILILFLPNIAAYEKIIEFDDNEDIILSTTVYNNSGKRCLDCTCNLTIYNPHPQDDTLNQSFQMGDKGNGIFATNLSNEGTDLVYSTNIYPISIVCNNSGGFFGGDTREGIKVSETMFEYSALIIPIIAIAFGLMWFGFKIDKSYRGMKTLTVFSSLAFFFGAMALGWATMMKVPNYGDFKTMMIVLVSAFLMVLLGIMFLWFKEEIINSVKNISQKKY